MLKYALLMVLGALALQVPAGEPDGEGSQSMSATTQAAAMNRLRTATSPYLRQHAHNPVDWHEWGPDAFARARAEDKPIFLSVGYAACHWCHVMAHESFEDAEIAAVMNEHFVNIKVDREERPDIDEVYMQATMVLNNGQGGWPMSVWLTPDLKPFFAGTYFPPVGRYGRPGFRELCEAIAKAWAQRRDDIVTQADKLTEVVQESLQAEPVSAVTLDQALVQRTAAMLVGAMDTVSGGIVSGGTNKFPPSMSLALLLRATERMPRDAAQRQEYRKLVELTLDHMATGGIYDQLAGGIHRYSTDVEWHVPHFEKMLYDQALVSGIYLDAWQATGKAEYARMARDIFDYVLRDLRSPEGAFCSSRDADSEGQEGKYYVWTREEVLALLGPEDGKLFAAHYDVSESGNWDDPQEPGVAKSVLRALRDHRCCAKLYGITPEECAERLARGREKLLAAREKRTAPGRDDKVLCEWNGLMIASLARGGALLEEPKYTTAAARAAEFILERQYQDGRLRRSYRDGRTMDKAFLSDYACVIEGLLELYEATFERRWLDRAAELNRATLELFWDEQHGAFFFTANGKEQLIARSKDVRDAAVPSGNSVQLMNLLRLAALLGDDDLRKRAERTMEVLAGPVRRSPWTAERFLAAVDFAHSGAIEIAIVGDPADAATKELLRSVYRRYLPNRVLMLKHPEQPQLNPDVPLLANREQLDGRPTAYVCRNYVCQRPVTTADELGAQLAR